MKIRHIAAIVGILAALSTGAQAQTAAGNEFVTATPNRPVTGVMMGCWDPTNLRWTPATTTGTCLGSGGGGGGGGATTIADGADVAEGSTADALWAGTGIGTMVAINKYSATKLEAVRALLAGTLTINLPAGASTAANQTNGTQQSKITDGTNISAVKAASIAPVATDPALVVAIRPDSFNANGQQTAAASAPVVLASDQTPPVPSGNSTYGVPSAQCTVACGSLIAKASSGNLYTLDVRNGDTAGFVLVFDSATVPADGTVTPKKCYDIAASATFPAGWNIAPAAHASGIVVVLNTGTGATCFNKVIATGTKLGFIGADYK